MTRDDDVWMERMRALYEEQLQGVRDQTLATWRTYLQAIAELRDLKAIVLEEKETRIARQGVLDGKLKTIEQRLDTQDSMLRWIRRIVIIAAVAAGIVAVFYLGTLV